MFVVSFTQSRAIIVLVFMVCVLCHLFLDQQTPIVKLAIFINKAPLAESLIVFAKIFHIYCFCKHFSHLLFFQTSNTLPNLLVYILILDHCKNVEQLSVVSICNLDLFILSFFLLKISLFFSIINNILFENKR